MKDRFISSVKKAAKESNMSLRELARNTGLDVSFISKILSGSRNPPSSEKDIIKIARALDIMPERLIIDAGRIPTSLRHIFSDEKYLRSLLGESVREPAPEPDTVSPSAGVLEDELL